MLKSLRARVLSLALLVCAGGLGLGGMLLYSALDARDAFHLVRHTQEVMLQLDAVDSNLREAESGVRGYLLTGSVSYLDGFENNIELARRGAARIQGLVADNPPQAQRAAVLVTLVGLRTKSMSALFEKVRRDPGKFAYDPAKAVRAKRLSDNISQTIGAMRQVERTLLEKRGHNAEAVWAFTNLLVFLSAPFLILIVSGAAWAIIRGIDKPLADVLAAVARFGEGARDARVQVGGGTEFRRLGDAYNAMADRLVHALEHQEESERALAAANAQLVQHGKMLEARSQSIELIGGMSHRLQALREPGELAEVLECFLPQVLPTLRGHLYLFNNSRNLLVRAASWGEPVDLPETFTPDDCWGLRRGLAHLVTDERKEVLCRHADANYKGGQLCKPVMAGGEILGLLYVQGAICEEDRFRLVLLVENVALALVNENLRKRLRDQSIRDPLTGLFNRRYMEEALSLESARSLRNDAPLSVIMTDVDHFKRFNDRHGHPAGDALLKSIATLMQSHFREGDIICRYGGEEFAIIAPGADLDLIRARAEALRLAARELRLTFDGAEVGEISMSFGVACSQGRGGAGGHDLIVEADQALYRAKRDGRDRVEVALPKPKTRAA